MVAFHLTSVDDFGAVSQLLPLMEAALRPFGGRPHMGKVFTMAPARVQEAGFDADSLTRFRDLVVSRRLRGTMRALRPIFRPIGDAAPAFGPLTRFRDLVKRYDPEGCFTNKFVETCVLGDGGDDLVAELHH